MNDNLQQAGRALIALAQTLNPPRPRNPITDLPKYRHWRDKLSQALTPSLFRAPNVWERVERELEAIALEREPARAIATLRFILSRHQTYLAVSPNLTQVRDAATALQALWSWCIHPRDRAIAISLEATIDVELPQRTPNLPPAQPDCPAIVGTWRGTSYTLRLQWWHERGFPFRLALNAGDGWQEIAPRYVDSSLQPPLEDIALREGWPFVEQALPQLWEKFILPYNRHRDRAWLLWCEWLLEKLGEVNRGYILLEDCIPPTLLPELENWLEYLTAA